MSFVIFHFPDRLRCAGERGMQRISQLSGGEEAVRFRVAPDPAGRRT
jgi:hypothetical protein